MDTIRKEALDANYELYHMPGTKEAAKKIDAAIVEATSLTENLVCDKGASIYEAMMEAATEVIRPVMNELINFGAGDTEPEWHVCDVLCSLVNERFGTSFEGTWDLRGCL